MKLSRLVLSSTLVIGLVVPVSVAQAAPVTIATKAKAVKKCTLEKKASCKSKGVTKQKVGKKDLSGIKLSKGKITKSQFTGTKMVRADFSGSSIQDTSFSGTDLKDANFKGATLKNVTFKAGSNLREVDFSGATLDHVEFKGIKVSSTSTFKLRGVTQVCNASSTCGSMDFSGADVLSLIINASQLDGMKFVNSSVDSLLVNASSMTNTDFSGATFGSFNSNVSNYNNSIFRSIRCSPRSFDGNGDSFNNTSWFDADPSCIAQMRAIWRVSYTGAYGMNGSSLIDISVPSGASPVKILAIESDGTHDYASVCNSTRSCVIRAQVGYTTNIRVWTALDSLSKVGDDITCGTTTPNDLVENANYLTICVVSPQSVIAGSRSSVSFSAGYILTVNGVQFMNPSRSQSFRSIQIYSGSTRVKLCSNASTCSATVAANAQVHIVVTSSVSEIWINQTAPTLNDSVGLPDPPSAGVYSFTTNVVNVVENITYQAVLSG